MSKFVINIRLKEQDCLMEQREDFPTRKSAFDFLNQLDKSIKYSYEILEIVSNESEEVIKTKNLALVL